MPRIRPSGPVASVRPFEPQEEAPNSRMQQQTDDKISEALDHIARSLAGIDHNLETLVGVLRERFTKADD